jgi:hypothetical protein
MKNATLISGILSWINLIVGIFLVVAGLMSVAMSPAMVAGLLSLMLVVAIILHSYAALQLRRSIIHPEIPLSSNTPTGIKFIGFVALFFSIMNIFQAVALLGKPEIIADMMDQQLPEQLQGMDLRAIIRFAGIIMLAFGLSVAVNVLINLNLLKWYQNKDQIDE